MIWHVIFLCGQVFWLHEANRNFDATTVSRSRQSSMDRELRGTLNGADFSKRTLDSVLHEDFTTSCLKAIATSIMHRSLINLTAAVSALSVLAVGLGSQRDELMQTCLRFKAAFAIIIAAVAIMPWLRSGQAISLWRWEFGLL
ncbi:hypothetical protein KVT40_001732 [Elsinoe batatas]|uniref:Uncharacterized protein n=1 Tax=Elsinoe batatas TaxID=2601811 RepID=A0A8K0LDA6_9PEZI|nr:hypothetical protein KVT40_001732 [Elsinoe batatas]